jgi:hypothetical protein
MCFFFGGIVSEIVQSFFPVSTLCWTTNCTLTRFLEQNIPGRWHYGEWFAAFINCCLKHIYFYWCRLIYWAQPWDCTVSASARSPRQLAHAQLRQLLTWSNDTIGIGEKSLVCTSPSTQASHLRLRQKRTYHFLYTLIHPSQTRSQKVVLGLEMYGTTTPGRSFLGLARMTWATMRTETGGDTIYLCIAHIHPLGAMITLFICFCCCIITHV